jgi:hypothetical protein
MGKTRNCTLEDSSNDRLPALPESTLLKWKGMTITKRLSCKTTEWIAAIKSFTESALIISISKF